MDLREKGCDSESLRGKVGGETKVGMQYMRED